MKKPSDTLSPDVLDFAPGLLAIQERPPERLPRVIVYSISILFFILLLWACFGKLDIVASAEGRLVPQNYVKIVQPAEGGIVHEILVTEGQEVKKGQTLLTMDAQVSNADMRTLQSQFALQQLQLRRIDAELASTSMSQQSNDPTELYLQINQQGIAHRQAYLDAVAQEQANIERTRQDLHAAQEVLTKLQVTLPNYKKTAEAFGQLSKEGYYSALGAEEKQRELVEKQQDLAAQQANVSSLKAQLQASEKKLAQLNSNYRSELQKERVETVAEHQRLKEEVTKQAHKSSLLALKAPEDGLIKDLATHTIGTVVSPGTVMMSLVPHQVPLQAEVYVQNDDVGFVHEGQSVKLKLAAYPFQKYGMLMGKVHFVGPDAIDPTNPAAQSSAVSSKQPQTEALNLRYKALLTLDAQYLNTDGSQMKLSPGMQVVAEIHQGKRTVMEYILSPLQKAWQEAGRER